MADLLALRKTIKKKKPSFKRSDYSKKVRIGLSWRKPKGLHSKMRHKAAGHAEVVSIGWGSPLAVEGMHKSGLMPMMVNNQADANAIDPKRQGAVIAAGVGVRSRLVLVEALLKRQVRILNIKDAKGYAASIAADIKARKEAVAKAKQSKTQKAPVQKKEEPKKELSAEDQKEQQRREAEKVLTQKER